VYCCVVVRYVGGTMTRELLKCHSLKKTSESFFFPVSSFPCIGVALLCREFFGHASDMNDDSRING
jgi:hypothetical protein